MSTQSSTSNVDNEFLGFFGIGLIVAVLIVFSHGRPENLFAGLEMVSLCIVSGLSTGNYYLTRVAMAEAGSPLKGARFFSLVIINVILFAIAIWLVELTEIFVLIVTAIYLAFSFTNTYQVKTLAISKEKTEPHFRVTVTSAIWLKEENGISVVAFTFVLGTLLLITASHLIFGHIAHDEFYLQIKAFAGGAATFHLVVSVFKYWLIYRKKDVVETTLRSLNAKVLAHPQSTSLGDLFDLSDSLRNEFKLSSAAWFKSLVALGILATVFAFSCWGLNRWKHNPENKPSPPPKEAQSQNKPVRGNA